MEISIKKNLKKEVLLSGTSSATGNPRNKTKLQPGHSLIDWVKLGRSGLDLTGVGGHMRSVNRIELSKHNKEDDAWIAIHGKVYNITPYLNFHPGGVFEIMRGAGSDATALFNEIHSWVNIDSLLKKCFIGNYITGNAQINLSVPKTINGNSLNLFANIKNMMKPHYNLSQTSNSVILNVSTHYKKLKKHHVIIDKFPNDNIITISILISQNVFIINLGLIENVANDYSVEVSTQEGLVDVIIKKIKEEIWPIISKPDLESSSLHEIYEHDLSFRKCVIKSIENVTHDTKLYSLSLPHGCLMSVPVGHHIILQVNNNGICIRKPYTVIPTLLFDSSNDSLNDNLICLLIKIYQEGGLTSILETLKKGSKIEMSQLYLGSFDVSLIEDFHNIYMFAAGTGFTPMIGVIRFCIENKTHKNNIKNVKLFFFNKTEIDIIYQSQLDKVSQNNKWFQAKHILSNPSNNWTGLKGRLNEQLFKSLVPNKLDNSEKRFFLSCGPVPFSELTKELFLKNCSNTDEYHIFT